MTLPDRSLPDGLSEVRFAGARWTEKQSVLVPRDEVSRRKLEDEASVDLLVEIEVEIIESPLAGLETVPVWCADR